MSNFPVLFSKLFAKVQVKVSKSKKAGRPSNTFLRWQATIDPSSGDAMTNFIRQEVRSVVHAFGALPIGAADAVVFRFGNVYTLQYEPSAGTTSLSGKLLQRLIKQH